MTRRAPTATLVVLALLGFGCTKPPEPAPADEHAEPSPSPTEAPRPRGLRPGGDTTVALGPSPSFVVPAANLTDTQKSNFYAGKALTTQPWIRAPTTTDARDGLGPLYHARSCLACHVKGGRGQAANATSSLATLVRLSIPGAGPHGEPRPDPTYGTQFQPQSTALAHQVRGQAGAEAYEDEGAPPEGDVRIRWTKRPFTYPDGATLDLRTPALELTDVRYGPLAEETRASLRHTPALLGMGLLELIEQSSIDALADPEDGDGDGVSGRINHVWDPDSKSRRPGRFGLKANQPSLRVQIAAALAGDMGLSSPVFPEQPCTKAQARCSAAPNGNDADGFEVPDDLLQLMTFSVMSAGVPERRKPDNPMVLRGQTLFEDSGCAACHTPHFVTARDPAFPHLSSQDIWPYTDLLLHDMGADLADGREDFGASASEWRTPPLWGAGLARAMHERVGFLHDGRAQSIEEAIVWHDGEARSSRDHFAALPAEDRRALVAFVRSL